MLLPWYLRCLHLLTIFTPGTESKAEGSVFDIRVGLDLDQHVRGNQAPDFRHAGGRTDVAKAFTVGLADFLPVRDVHDVYAFLPHPQVWHPPAPAPLQYS